MNIDDDTQPFVGIRRVYSRYGGGEDAWRTLFALCWPLGVAAGKSSRASSRCAD